MTDKKGPIDINDISLSNCYTGIAVTQGDGVDTFNVGEDKQPVSIGKVTIKNIMGSPMHTGILVKGIASKVAIENVQFNYSVYYTKFVEERTLYARDIILAAASDSFVLISSKGFSSFVILIYIIHPIHRHKYINTLCHIYYIIMTFV